MHTPNQISPKIANDGSQGVPINIISLFPNPAVVVNIDRSFTNSELQLLSSIPMRKKEHGPNHMSKDTYLFDTFAEELKDIKKFCEQQVEQYLIEIEGVDTSLANLRITQAWLNKTKPQECHHPHIHPNSYLSGVFYINCLPDDQINFTMRANVSYGAVSMEFPQSKLTEWNSTGLHIDVKKGDLIIFPSWVPHHVNVNQTKDTERISLSFNTFPIGKMGRENHASHLIL